MVALVGVTVRPAKPTVTELMFGAPADTRRAPTESIREDPAEEEREGELPWRCWALLFFFRKAGKEAPLARASGSEVVVVVLFLEVTVTLALAALPPVLEVVGTNGMALGLSSAAAAAAAAAAREGLGTEGEPPEDEVSLEPESEARRR